MRPKEGIVARRSLSKDELGMLKELADRVNAEDGIAIKLNWETLKGRKGRETNDYCYYAGGRLVGFLGLYIFRDEEAEVSGLVHPDYRRQGIFTRLVKRAADDCSARGIPQLLFICPRDSGSGHAFLRSWGADYSFSEYVMERPAGVSDDPQVDRSGEGRKPAEGVTLVEASLKDRAVLGRMNRLGFAMPEKEAEEYAGAFLGKPGEATYIGLLDGEPAGKICVQFSSSHSFLYGFTVLPAFRSKGIGRAMLEQTIDAVQHHQGDKPVRLEVALENKGALQLYLSCGFQERAIQDYLAYRLRGR
ncbi:GNAT family N-acetyltransferase [Paenibacillus sp. J31TS4]|uniref:GNAT family N-acetyltransferase n=1 Tax=Paenibacillus sp. J31TS4 TaxID=2807195 RepID=UPI001B2B0BE1|nr:GNAT family N-acetyltransferase [Paenibacillus sp. J31TS4]GIP40362.1 GNAT family N-acetyltransferase [Paenibacillus sp. J31TS4]